MKYKTITLAVAGAVAAMAMTGTSFAAAATAAAAAPNAGGAATAGDVLIVTARKHRHDKGFKSGQSVKTLDQDQIRAAGAVGGVSHAL